MHKEIITLAKNNFHMRPLALINSIAAFFPDNCRMYIVYKNDHYNIKSFMNLVNFMIAFTVPPFTFELQVEFAFEDKAKFCLLILKTLFLNLSLVYLSDVTIVRSKDEESAAYKAFLTVMENAVHTCTCIQPDEKEQFIEHLREVLGLKKCRKKARINSVKGLHAVACAHLRLIGSLLNCKITLDCTNTQGEPQNCEITDIMGLLNLNIPDGSMVYVNSEGKNCEETTEIIIYILEHIDTTMSDWQTHNLQTDKKHWGNNLLNFIRCELKKR